MKKLFIYYSLTGNGDIVAETFKSKGYDIRKVISKIKYPKSKFFRIMYGGYRVCFNKKDKLVDFNSDISSYDEVVIGSPIWMDSICAPINSVLDKVDLTNKKVKFVFYSAGGEANRATEFVNKNYKSDIIILKEPKTNKNELKKIKK